MLPKEAPLDEQTPHLDGPLRVEAGKAGVLARRKPRFRYDGSKKPQGRLVEPGASVEFLFRNGS
ncbi:MAG: hypothetical protein JNK58_03365 [Phycisphaerae bacterium]|nr:hypothetical protein [Phycisphaerae bacterium]